MKFKLFVLAFIFIANGTHVVSQEKVIADIADKLTVKLVNLGKNSIAVTDFTDLSGNATELGRHLADQFTVAFTNSKNPMSVIDRSRINFLLKEQGLSATGLLDPSTAAKLGKIAGAKLILMGTITKEGDYIKLTTKALDLETAIVIAASIDNVTMTQSMKKLFETDMQSSNSQNTSPEKLSSTVRINHSTSTIQENMSSDCKIKNFGNFQFVNKTNTKIIVNAVHSEDNPYSRSKKSRRTSIKKLWIEAGKSKEVYEYAAGVYSYRIDMEMYSGRQPKEYSNGEIYLKRCKTYVLEIK